MNNKGFTLIEVITSITILSVASLMLFSGFLTILNFMQKSGEVKNASNVLLSVAEGTTNSEVKSKVRMASSPIKYTIKSDLVDDIEVMSRKYIFTPFDGTDILLRNISNAALPSLHTYHEYDEIKNLAEQIITLIDVYKPNFIYSSYNDMLTRIRTLEFPIEQKWPVFANNLLNKKLNSQEFIVPIFAFESLDDRGDIINHGDVLIYLSVFDSLEFVDKEIDKNFNEIIHYFYDSQSKDWYFTETDRYLLQHDEDARSVGLFAKDTFGVFRKFESYQLFIDDVKGSSKGDWKKLNGDAEFDGFDSSGIWL